MENTEIAGVFNEIADLLEIKGENPFRIRSYRNAALVIEGLPESLSALYEHGHGKGLPHIPGIGVSIGEKIIEMLTTGRCGHHEELLRELPHGVLDILKISGVGPRKAAVLYKELGIKSVAELTDAALRKKLRDLPGFGEKTEENILKGIKDRQAVSGRHNIAAARQCAGSFMEYILKIPGVIEAVPAGSLRRWKDSIGDIDILTTCEDPALVMDRFAAHPDVKEVLAKGETKSTVLLKAGIQVDIRVVEEKSFGAALQYFTGSKAHNIALRERAKKLGYKISEYGVFSEKTGKWLAGRTEEDVYKMAGLPLIPPELRENRGEIEAALKGRLPITLEVTDIKGDLHAHTNESDGGSSMEEMAEAALKLGYEYLAITDHSKAVGIAHGLDGNRALKQMEAIDGYNERLKKRGKKFRLLKGAEVDIRADGTLDHPAGVTGEMDCVVGAVHSGFNMPLKEMTARIVKGIRSGRINIFAHPTGRLIGVRPPYQVDMDAIMDEAERYGVTLEMNSCPERLDLNDAHCKLAKEKGVMVAISTDSHAAAHLENITYGIHTARRGWLEKKDVLNTKGLKDLMKALKARA